MLECNKNDATLSFKCILKNSKKTLSASEINRRLKLEKILKEIYEYHLLTNAFPGQYTPKQ